MKSFGKQTRLKPAQVIEKAVAFFGPTGVGLQVQDQGGDCARFEGGGGFVFISTCEGEKRTEVSLETREWEIPSEEFISRL